MKKALYLALCLVLFTCIAAAPVLAGGGGQLCEP